MSMRASLGSPIPEETVRIAHAAFPKGNVFMQMRDALGSLYSDAQFAGLFSHTGQPAEEPARLALVLVRQFTEGLSDRQAANAVRGRIDWKYALALELTDPGFDASVLSKFRTHLIQGKVEHLLLETMLTLLQERSLLKARGDPTYGFHPHPGRYPDAQSPRTGGRNHALCVEPPRRGRPHMAAGAYAAGMA